MIGYAPGLPQAAERALSEAEGPLCLEQADPGPVPSPEGVRSAAPAEQPGLKLTSWAEVRDYRVPRLSPAEAARYLELVEYARRGDAVAEQASDRVPNTPTGVEALDHSRDDALTPAESPSLWMVWFAYYSETANVGIVEADSADDACQKFWGQHGDHGHWPYRGVHALPVAAGQSIEIHAQH